MEKYNIQSSDLAGIYKDIAEVIGLEATILLHKDFHGQQITFPKKLYSKSFILKQIKGTEEPHDVRKLAKQYGYTERRIRQLIKENTVMSKEE